MLSNLKRRDLEVEKHDDTFVIGSNQEEIETLGFSQHK